MPADRTARIFNCWRFFVFLHLFGFCISGVAISVFALYLLLIHYETHVLVPKIIIYFLLVPTISTTFTTFIGWTSIGRKNARLVKVFAVLIGIAVVLEISGSLWCFSSLQKLEEEISVQMNGAFMNTIDLGSNNYWSRVEAKYKCCGINGPVDYRSQKLVPYSCCGSDDQSNVQGDCQMIWQKGCVSTMSASFQRDLINLSLLTLCMALLQIPGVFVSWCFSRRVAVECRRKNQNLDTVDKLLHK